MIAQLQEFKDYIRETTNDLNDVFTLALESASSEVRHFLGFDPELESPGPESDVVMAAMLLAAVHADVGLPEVNEYRRTAAHRLLTPYRLNTGFGATPDS